SGHRRNSPRVHGPRGTLWRKQSCVSDIPPRATTARGPRALADRRRRYRACLSISSFPVSLRLAQRVDLGRLAFMAARLHLSAPEELFHTPQDPGRAPVAGHDVLQDLAHFDRSALSTGLQEPLRGLSIAQDRPQWLAQLVCKGLERRH